MTMERLLFRRVKSGLVTKSFSDDPNWSFWYFSLSFCWYPKSLTNICFFAISVWWFRTSLNFHVWKTWSKFIDFFFFSVFSGCVSTTRYVCGTWKLGINPATFLRCGGVPPTFSDNRISWMRSWAKFIDLISGGVSSTHETWGWVQICYIAIQK